MSYDLMFDIPTEICVENVSTGGDFYAGLIRSYADYAEWESDAGAIISLDPTPEFYNQISIRLNNYGENRYVRTREVNACGAGPWLTKYFDLTNPVNGCSGVGGGFGRIAIYPNPASEEVYIEELIVSLNSGEYNTS